MIASEKAAPGLEFSLLGLLRDEPMHAYEMYGRLAQAEALGLVWHIKQGHLYALLARLEEAGYVGSMTQLQANRPPRKVLHLTEEGRAAFERWLGKPVAHGRDFRLEFLAKLYFAAREGGAAARGLIERQRNACDGWLGAMREGIIAAPTERPFDRLVLQFRASQIEAIRAWLDDCAATVGGGPDSASRE